MNNIEARLTSLERTNRMYRLTVIAFVLGAIAIATTGFDEDVPDVIRARRFEVIDSTGLVLFEAGSDADGGRTIVRRRGGGGAMMFSNSEGGALALLNPSGHVPFRAGVSPKGGLMVLTNSTDQFVLVAAADDSASGVVVLYDTSGSEIWHAP